MTRYLSRAIGFFRDDELFSDTGSLSRWERLGPIAVLAVAVLFGLIGLQSETTNVPTLNDSSVHQEMVRFADQLIRQHHFPLMSWFPFLGLGSPQFLHYQSGGVLLTALLGLFVGADPAFNWMLYLLLALWPISIYWACRIFGWGRWQSAGAALVSPMLVSVIGVGYEQQSYIFSGFGVWTQLWAMWTLPLAWAFSWRAVSHRRYVLPACIFIALTVAFHFLTGYLAFLPILLWTVLRPSNFLRRFGRAAIVGVGSVLLTIWVIYPLLVDGKWASVNELLQNSPDADSYGARQVLSWLFTGGIYDAGRFPSVTILVFVGAVVCAIRFKSDERARAILSMWIFSIILFFGRPTLGPLVDLLPGSHDLFLRRFIVGVQLSGIILAGIGLFALASLTFKSLKYIMSICISSVRFKSASSLFAVAAIVILCLAPAWSQIATMDQSNASIIAGQQSADETQGVEMQSIISKIEQLGGGRTYAGLNAPSNWGQSFTVGDVPVFKYLAAFDIEEVGYTLRTASLMTIPEAYFDETLPSNYQLFGIRFLVLPPNREPSVPAHFVLRSGQYLLYTVDSGGYIQMVDTSGSITANRKDLGSQTSSFVDSDLANDHIYPTIAYAGGQPAPPTVSDLSQALTSPGKVTSETIDLQAGAASARVDATRTAVVLLKVSYDPGWQVTVDGIPSSTEMVAPALVGVTVSPGIHTVSFDYVGYPNYLWLFLISLITLIGLAFLGRRWKHKIN